MRLNLSSVLALALLTGCGAKYKPGTAVLTGWDRTRTFAVDETSKVQYTDQARVQPPIVPQFRPLYF